jgi:DNA-binding response OmpR family regulator
VKARGEGGPQRLGRRGGPLDPAALHRSADPDPHDLRSEAAHPLASPGYEFEMARMRILVIEDDAAASSLVGEMLRRADMDVILAGDGREGLRRFYDRNPDLVIIDIRIPELDGWQVLERVRELSDVPVLILTVSDAELDKVRALRQGADDYLTKPFGRAELIARIEALLRRSGRREAPSDVLADELVEIDLPRRRVAVLGNEVSLTPTEFKLLVTLARHSGQVLSREQLVAAVWGRDGARSTEQVKLYVSYVRRKLRAAAGVDPIQTVRGFGYRYRPHPPEPG